MKISSRTLILTVSFILVVLTVAVYEYKRPSCVDAQCIDVFNAKNVQTCATGECWKCGSKSCSMTPLSNQFCGLTSIRIGDMGGGDDRASCYFVGTYLVAGTNKDGLADCQGMCVNYY
jgi:hypothetical protein